MAAVSTPKAQRPKSSIESGKRLLDTQRLCDFLSISDDTLAKLMADPEARFPIPVGIVQGKRHWTLESIERYVARCESEAKKVDRR